jgi:predicted benzoate:H+ symporter BenE
MAYEAMFAIVFSFFLDLLYMFLSALPTLPLDMLRGLALPI